MYKICICDDKPDEINDLSAKIKLCFEKTQLDHVIKSFTSPADLFREMNHGRRYDIFFLDIIMPDIDGMELATKIREKDENCTIVFVTLSKDYAIGGYRVGALDYLVKPVLQENMELCVNNIIARMTKSGTLAVRFDTKNGIVEFDLNEILYLESSDHYVYFHLLNDNMSKVYGSLSDFTPILTRYSFFARCHKSYIVNLKHVKKYANGLFILKNGKQINISRQYQSSCKSKYSNYIADKMMYG